MAAKDPTVRRLAAKTAINLRYARMSPDERAAVTEAARAALQRQLEDQVDPQRELDPEDRAQRVAFLRRAVMADRSRLAVKARQAKLAAQRAAEADVELDAILTARYEAGVR